MRTVFTSEGDIRSTDVLAALVALWREGASGSLQFQRSGASAGFELVAGDVVGGSSSDARFDTAAILVRAGKLEASTFERLSVTEGTDRAVAALQAGILTRREWRWGEKIRAVEVLSDLLTWIEGDYTFFRTPAREAGEFRLTIPRLVLELFLRSRDRSLVLHHLGGADVPLVRDSRFDAEFSTFGLTDDAESVVRLIDGESTAAEIASEAPAESFAVEKLLAALVTLGLVHPAYGASEADFGVRPAAPPPAPPGTDEADEIPREDLSDDEPELEPELEPEVDIEEKQVPLEDEAAPEEAGEIAAEDSASDSFVDAPLEAREPADELDEQTERLATDLDGGRPIPGDLMEPDAAAASEASTFDRPLDLTTGVGAIERPEHRSTSPLLGILFLVATVVAGVVYWRARRPARPAASVAAAFSPSPTLAAEPTGGVAAGALAATPVLATMPPTLAPVSTAVATRRIPTAEPTRPAPTADPASRPAVAPTPRAPAAVPTRRSSALAAAPRSRQQWLSRAERDSRIAAADARALFTVQLELACEVPSLTQAWTHDRPGGSMWVTTTSYKGKTCFKVFWGRYPTREAAESGLAAAPRFFSTSRNHPMVVSVR